MSLSSISTSLCKGGKYEKKLEDGFKARQNNVFLSAKSLVSFAHFGETCLENNDSLKTAFSFFDEKFKMNNTILEATEFMENYLLNNKDLIFEKEYYDLVSYYIMKELIKKQK